jgi:tetratricopeptide (TPR) repeat protein
VFWVHASSLARFEEGYRRIANAVKLPDYDKPEANILQLTHNWLCDKTNGHWAMMIDNADDPSVLFGQPDRTKSSECNDSTQASSCLADFLPQSPNGSILITSRNRDVAHRLTGSSSNIIKVEPMDQSDALALLHKKLQGDLSTDDAVELLQTLDYMPLAITQAAAYISQRAPRITISRYLDNLRRSDKDRATLLKKDVGDVRRDGSASNSIIATWQISFEHIRKERPAAARLLSLMSLFDRQGIPDSLLYNHYQEGDDIEADFEEDIYTLASYSLVGTNVEGKEFEMHRLVQFSTKKWLELRDELERWKETYITIMEEAFPVGQHENWATCQRLFPHAEIVLTYRPANDDYLAQWASILFDAAWYAGDKGNYSAAEEMSRRALEGYRKARGVEHSDTLASMANLAMVLRNQGKYEEAEAMNRRALDGYEKELGKEHPDTLASVGNLASVLRNQGKYEEAETMNRRALDGKERILGKEHPNTLTSLSNLAVVLRNQGKYEEAEAMNQRALDGREKILGKEHPNTLTNLSNLALVLQDQGKYEEAEAMNQRALDGREKMLGKEHPDTLTSVENLASTLQDQGKYEEAEAMSRRALGGMEMILGKEHPYTLTSLSNLASVLQDQGKYEEAETMSRRALDGTEKILGKEHPHALTSVNTLALILQDQEKYEEAEAISRRALDGRERILGKEHPHTLTSVSNLASVLRYQGKYEEAEAMNRRALDGREKILGKEHPDTLTSVENLASILQDQGKCEEAEAMNRRALNGTLTGVTNF